MNQRGCSGCFGPVHDLAVPKQRSAFWSVLDQRGRPIRRTFSSYLSASRLAAKINGTVVAGGAP